MKQKDPKMGRPSKIQTLLNRYIHHYRLRELERNKSSKHNQLYTKSFWKHDKELENIIQESFKLSKSSQLRFRQKLKDLNI